MDFRFIPRSITKFKPTKYFAFNNEFIKQTQESLDSYDYHLKEQHTPIIYFRKSFQDIETNNHYIIKNKLNDVLPKHKINFWKKEYSPEYVVIGGNKCLPIPNRYSVYDEVKSDYLITRIWYNNKDIDVLMERGNFFYNYLIEINQSHRFIKSDKKIVYIDS